MRPWYRIHLSTLFVLAIVVAALVFINIPGDRMEIISNRFYHGWPYPYFDREGSEHSFWSFTGTATRFHGGALLLNVLAAACIVALAAFACELWIRRSGRLLRFGTRSLLVATALIAALLGLAVRDVRRCSLQQRALAELSQFGSLETRRDLRKFDWIRSLFGDHFHGTIRIVRLTAHQPVDRLPDLRVLSDVRFIVLEMPGIPENIDQIAELPKLNDFSVILTSLAETEQSRLTALTELPRLDGLQLLGDHIGDNDVLRISAESRVRAITISSPKITEKSLHHLSRLKQLSYLTLDETVIQSADASALSRFANLLSLHFLGNSLTAQDAEKLQSLWPNAKVEFGGKSAFSSTNPVWETSLRMSRD